MKHRSLNLLIVLSLLLCVATTVAWPVSYRRGFSVTGPLHAHGVGVVIIQGSFVSFCHNDPAYLPSEWRGSWDGTGGEQLDHIAEYHGLGFGFAWKSELKFVYVPLWFVEIGLICCSALLVYRSRRKTPAGVCLRCGYDLRATPDRCPECGTMPEKTGAVS
jgi:hypothetical protein